MPCQSGAAVPPVGRGGRGLIVSIVLLVLALPGGCERPPLPGAQDPPAGAPPVTTRGPDDAALTTADVTRPGTAPVADAAPESQWRQALAQGAEATLTLPANTGSGELPAEAAKQLDALARLLDAERDWRLTISVEEAPAASTPSSSPSSLQQAQAFRLALLSRGVAAGRVQAEPASRPHPAPPAGTVRVRLRRLPPTDRPIPAPRRWS